MLLAALILLSWGALQIFADGGGTDKPAAAPTTQVTTAPPAPAPVTNGEVTVNLASGAAACDPEQVRVTPSVAPGQLTGMPVKVTMSVSTTQSEPCVLNAKAADLLVVISANKKPVWDSSVCKTALITRPVGVTPRWATVVETTWSGRGSGKQCSPREGFASPGGYVLKAATLGGEIGQTSFNLSNKPKPSSKPSDKPTDAKTTVTPPPAKTSATPAD